MSPYLWSWGTHLCSSFFSGGILFIHLFMFSHFGETFSVALDISKSFDRVWHHSLLSKLPSFGFYPSLCSCIFSFLSDRSISAVVDGHYSSPRAFNSDVPQGSVLSPTLFLLVIKNLSITKCPIHSYADNSTLHYSASFNRRPSRQELRDSRLEASKRLNSDLNCYHIRFW